MEYSSNSNSSNSSNSSSSSSNSNNSSYRGMNNDANTPYVFSN